MTKRKPVSIEMQLLGASKPNVNMTNHFAQLPNVIQDLAGFSKSVHKKAQRLRQDLMKNSRLLRSTTDKFSHPYFAFACMEALCNRYIELLQTLAQNEKALAVWENMLNQTTPFKGNALPPHSDDIKALLIKLYRFSSDATVLKELKHLISSDRTFLNLTRVGAVIGEALIGFSLLYAAGSILFFPALPFTSVGLLTTAIALGVAISIMTFLTLKASDELTEHESLLNPHVITASDSFSEEPSQQPNHAINFALVSRNPQNVINNFFAQQSKFNASRVEQTIPEHTEHPSDLKA